MHEMQTIVTDVCGVCLSRGSVRLHFAKTDPDPVWVNIVLDGGFDPPHKEREGDSMQPSPDYFGLLFSLSQPSSDQLKCVCKLHQYV